MKTSVIFSGGVKQIMLTPENKDEEFALSLITQDEDIELLIRKGSLLDEYSLHNKNRHYSGHLSKCTGGWVREFNDYKSKILVLTPKTKEI